MFDIRDHGGSYGGGISSEPSFEEIGTVSGVVFNTTYQRWVLSKDYFYARNDASPSSFSIIDLINNVKYADIVVRSQNDTGYLKADSYDDDLFGQNGAGELIRFNKDMSPVWKHTSSSKFTTWSAVCLTKNYIYGLNTVSPYDIVKIDRITGLEVGRSTQKVLSSGVSSLSVSTDGTKLIYMYNTSSYIRMYVFDPESLGLSYQVDVVTSLSRTAGADIQNDVLFVILIDQNGFTIKSLYDISKITPSLTKTLSQNIGISSFALNFSMALNNYKEGVFINTGTDSLITKADQKSGITQRIPFTSFSGAAYGRITNKRYSFLTVPGVLIHGKIK